MFRTVASKIDELEDDVQSLRLMVKAYKKRVSELKYLISDIDQDIRDLKSFNEMR